MAAKMVMLAGVLSREGPRCREANLLQGVRSQLQIARS